MVFMYDQDREELRKAADAIWELAKNTPSSDVENVLKQLSTALHHCAGGRKSGIILIDELNEP